MSSQRLLPVYEKATVKPVPIFNFKITPPIKEYIQNNGKLKIFVKDGEMFLQINSTEDKIKLEKRKVTTPVTVYKQFASTTFKNLGNVGASLILDPSNKVEISIPVPNPVLTPAHSPIKELKKNGTTVQSRAESAPLLPNGTTSTTSSSSITSSRSQNRESSSTSTNSKAIPTGPKVPAPPAPLTFERNNTFQHHTVASQRFRYLLARGPMTDIELSKETTYSMQETREALKLIGMLQSAEKIHLNYPSPPKSSRNSKADLWVLSYRFYRELNVFSSRMYDDYQKKSIAENCLKVFKYMNDPRNDSTKNFILENMPSLKVDDLSNGTKRKSIEKTGDLNEVTKSKKEQRTGSNSSVSSNGSVISINTKKRKNSDGENDEDYYKKLAKRFKARYKEYESLYETVQKAKTNSNEANEDNIKKLYDLHQTLSSWKKQLWNSVSPK